ncbi:hypothetical protein DSO57_1016383 [Entomophthora muscae]|uniref:Uncharacterized protein n=1 Tax=Entomophthora muscae TaxID=34485 RepID=A0ACC2RJK3_9FUNG|nr:hypothetical protein DSO57_1016383 [Entomophthora muscae]
MVFEREEERKDGELYVSTLTFEDVKEYSKINYCAKFCTNNRATKRADTTKGLVGHVHEVGRITKTYISHRNLVILVKDRFRGPPLALDQDVFPRPSKKVARVQAKPLQNLEDLAHTVDKCFVLAFPAEVLISPLESPPNVEETLIQLDCLLSWCRPVLKQLANQQKNAGHMKLERSNLRPGEIGYQNPQPVVSQVANSSGPGVPQPETIGFRSSLVETSEEGIRGNVHPESLEGS